MESNQERVICAIFGISGVGKSTLIQRFIKDHDNWLHLQAGTLIKEALETELNRDELRLTGNDKILSNQQLMIGKFWNTVDKNPKKNIIFDGHSVIDTGTELLPIPTEIIKSIKPTCLIFIKQEPEIIRERRNKDKLRKRPELDLATLQKHQQAALEQYERYKERLSLKSYILEDNLYANLATILAGLPLT